MSQPQKGSIRNSYKKNFVQPNISNQIMIGCSSKNDSNRTTIYLPAYISVKLDNIDELSISENRAGVNLVIYFRVYFGDLGSQFADKFCQEFQIGSSREDQFRIKITEKQKKYIQNAEQTQQLNKDDTESQEQEEESANIQQKALDKTQKIKEFTIRKLFQVELYPYTYFTPFEIHDLTLCLELRTVKIKEYGDKKLSKQLQVKLNLMSVDVGKQTMRLKCINYNDFKAFGQYDLAENFLIFQNTLERTHKTLPNLFRDFPFRINGIQIDRDEKKKHADQITCIECKNFQYATFHFPIYRKPIIGFLSIYLPLWALSIITLSLYFTKNLFGERLIAIAALNLAFVPTIKIIRNQIPETRHLTFLQLGVYMQIASTFMLLLQNITKRGLTAQQYQFDAYHNGFYLTSLILFLIVLVCPLTTLLIYCILRIRQNKSSQRVRKRNQLLEFQFQRSQWNHNLLAKQYFKKKHDLYKFGINKTVEHLKSQHKKNNNHGKDDVKKSKILQKLKIPFQEFILQSDQKFLDQINKIRSQFE